MTVLATDNFNRANNATLGANWTAISTLSGSLIVDGNRATGQGGGAWGNKYTAVSFPNNQYGQATIAQAQSGGGIVLRVDGSGRFYLFNIDSPGASAACAIYYYDGSTFNLLATQTHSAVLNDVISFEANGTSLTGKINGSTVTTTTHSTLTAGAVGIYAYGTQTMYWDDWEGGDLAAAPTGRANFLTLLGVS